MSGAAPGVRTGARTLLGPADVDDAALTAMVGDQLGVADVELLDCEVEVVDDDLEVLTTAGRYWVRGTARRRAVAVRLPEVVQSWTRSPQFSLVPEDMRELAAAGLPWRSEPLVHRSDLERRLPAGLSRPRVHRPPREGPRRGVGLPVAGGRRRRRRVVKPATSERAACLLGRLAAGPAVEPVSRLGSSDVVRRYAYGRVHAQVLPALRRLELDPLRVRLVQRLNELGAAPQVTRSRSGDQV